MPCEGSLQDQMAAVQGHLSFDAHIDGLTVLLELPRIEAARARHTQVDALVTRQVMWRPGNAVGFQIMRRRDRYHTQRRSDPDRGHVLGELLAEPDAGIVALGDDVGEAGLSVDLDLDIRIPLEKVVNGWPENQSLPEDEFRDRPLPPNGFLHPPLALPVPFRTEGR